MDKATISVAVHITEVTVSHSGTVHVKFGLATGAGTVLQSEAVLSFAQLSKEVTEFTNKIKSHLLKSLGGESSSNKERGTKNDINIVSDGGDTTPQL